MRGGLFYANLFVQKQGVKYEDGGDKRPILPLFRLVDQAPPDKPLRPVAKDGPVFTVTAETGRGGSF